MELSIELKETFHKHGGRIYKITAIGHTVYPPKEGYSQDVWFYRGQVEWDDAPGKIYDHVIYPYHLCTNEGSKVGWDEINKISELMMEYLNEHGTWNRNKPPNGWYATKRK
jgi:hypothetical protein